MRPGLTAAAFVLWAACAAGAADTMDFERVQGTWYGWLAGTGMEVKIATLPEGAVAYLKTVQPGAQAFLQEVNPVIADEHLVLQSLHAPQPFGMRLRFEGQILFGTFDDTHTTYTVALARSMPDVEQLFVAPMPAAQPPSSVRSARAEGRRASSGRNMRQLGAALLAYASEAAEGRFPPLSREAGNLAPDGSAVYPRYVRDATLFIPPGHPDTDRLRALARTDPLEVISDHGYWYLGFTLPDEQTAVAFLEAYRALADPQRPVDLGETVTAAGVQIPRLREGVERLLVANPDDPAEAAAAMARIPILIERPGLHEGGSNVLFLDGRVEFMPYPGPYPMTEAVITRLQALDDLRAELRDDAGLEAAP
jgi:prepilin-type processing-associated H-X9-DG protein